MVNEDEAIWTSEQDLQTMTLIGELIADRYQVERLIGQGGMGSVYLATDQLLERQVAIKLMKPDIVHRQNPIRFYHEARLLARMNHPNIVTLYNCGWYHDQAYLIMEYVSGTLLSSLITNNTINDGLTIIEALNILMKVCIAIKYAHEHGVIHRDIKPGNVIVGEDVKLMDFGIAKLREDDPMPSVISMAEGTPLYVAPEQAIGGEINECSDMYSLGVVMYEVLTGRPPFLVNGEVSLMSQHTYMTPIAPHLRNPAINKSISKLIMRMLEKNSEDRPNSMSDVLEILAPVILSSSSDQNRIIPSRELPDALEQAKVQALRNLPLFTTITDEDLYDLSKKLIEKRYRKGETIINRNELGSSLHIIRKGRVRITLPNKDHQDITLSYLGASDFFGEMSLLDNKPRSATAIACEQTVTLMLSRGDFLDFLKWYPDAAISVLGVLAQRIRDLNSSFESVLSRDPRSRLAEVLNSIMKNHGVETVDGYVIQLPLTIRDLAEMCGTTQTRTRQLMRSLRTAGIVRSNRQRHTILKPEELQQLAFSNHT